MIKHITFLTVLFICHSAMASNDSTSKQKFKERLAFNMGGGINVSNNATIISLNPQLGYRVTKKFITGIGANFSYLKYNNSTATNLFYGTNAFARYHINNNFFLQTEYQLLTRDKSNVWDDYLLVGGGMNLGGNFFASIYYIVDPPANNVYNSPFVYRVGMLF